MWFLDAGVSGTRCGRLHKGRKSQECGAGYFVKDFCYVSGGTKIFNEITRAAFLSFSALV